jgi:hypothetical protein
MDEPTHVGGVVRHAGQERDHETHLPARPPVFQKAVRPRPLAKGTPDASDVLIAQTTPAAGGRFHRKRVDAPG